MIVNYYCYFSSYSFSECKDIGCIGGNFEVALLFTLYRAHIILSMKVLLYWFQILVFKDVLLI
jgi:hypothetical protein